MQIPFKWFLRILGLVAVLLVVPLFSISYKPASYVCINGVGFDSGDARPLITIKGFTLSSRPIVIDCPKKDRRDKEYIKNLPQG